MKATAKLYMVSSPADALFCALIDNDDVYKDFIVTNQARMAQAYDIVVRWCGYHKIKHTPCSAGHFILVDLTRFLPTDVDGQTLNDPAAREGALWTLFLKHAVCLTPGGNYHHPQLGVFRLTFTLRRPALLEGLARLERALGLPVWSDSEHVRLEPEAKMQTMQISVEKQQEPDNDTMTSMRTHTAQATISTNTSTDSQPSMRGSAHDRHSLSPTEAQAERQQYVDAVRQVLKNGGGSEALLSCGMGMSCSACT